MTRKKAEAMLVLWLGLVMAVSGQFDEIILRLRKPSPIEIAFVSPLYTVTEEVGEVRICLSVDAGLPVETLVELTSSQSTGPNAASAGLDFDPITTTLVLPPTQSPIVECVDHTRVLDDPLAAEGTEWFDISLEIIGQTVFGRREFEIVSTVGRTRVAILDNDNVTVQFQETNVTVGEGSGSVEVCLSVDTPTAQSIPVSIDTINTASAEDNVDYVPVSVNLTIPPSLANQSTCVEVTILEDKLAFEGDENFLVQLTPPTTPPTEGILFGNNLTTIVYILDNDNVTLTVAITERPGELRPVPGETVVFTCEVRFSSGIVWSSAEFGGDIVFVRAIHDVGDSDVDADTGRTAELVAESADSLISTLTYYNATADSLNDTVIVCHSADDPRITNMESVRFASVPNPPINVTVGNQVSCDCVNLSWTTPLYDGDSPLLYTQLEYYPLSNSNDTTTLQTSNGIAESLQVCGLEPNVPYKGNVWAVNAVGLSVGVAVDIHIQSQVPPTPLGLEIISRCADSALCFNGSVTISWMAPPTDLLCPVFTVHLNYSITELGNLIDDTQLQLSTSQTSYHFNSVAPGRTYLATVAYENEVGLSLDNPTAQEDVLVFASLQLQKLFSPSTILEGGNGIYSIKLNGPPPSQLLVDLINSDQFTKILTPQLAFNSSTWFQRHDLVVMATDDDVIRDSPYGALVTMETFNLSPDYERRINLSLAIQDTDIAEVIIVRREAYPYPPQIPEGGWAVYLVSLPNRPTDPLNIIFTPLNPSLVTYPMVMVFEPEFWNVTQELTLVAVDDGVNMDTVYESGFNMTLVSLDKNYGARELPEVNVTIEDNDEDSAVVSGTITWQSTSEQGRTAVTFDLSLILKQSYYPHINSSSVGSERIALPGEFQFGENVYLQVVGIYGDYLIASGEVLYFFTDYTTVAADYEYCCRGPDLINNHQSLFSVGVLVDVSQSASPLLPVIPLVNFIVSPDPASFYYTATHPETHPLVYYHAVSANYRSSQAGPPQGLKIEYSTGHVTWDSAHVIPGDYSLQIVTEDIFTGIKAVSEVLIRVSPSSSYSPPTISRPRSTLYTPHSHTLSTNITVTDSDSILGVELVPILPLPAGSGMGPRIMLDSNTAVFEFQWEPSEEQIGSRLLCFVASDIHSLVSPPTCLVVMVTESLTQLPMVNLTGTSETVSMATLTRGVVSSVPIADPTHSSIVSSQPIEHMVISIADSKDGDFESIQVINEFTHPSLTFTFSSPPNTDTPSVFFYRGNAPADVYTEALRNLVYVNSKNVPTVGERRVRVLLFDGQSTNEIAETIVRVEIQNSSPTLSVSGDDGRYDNVFFPHEGPVAAVNPTSAYIQDPDSTYIQSLTMQIDNVRNGPLERLAVTYVSPDSLGLPIIAEATGLGIPFGTLWRGEQVPSITSTISIEEIGSIGELTLIVDVRHSWIGDLRIELEHGGRRELIVLSPGGQICESDNLFRTTFESVYSSNVYLSKSTASPGVCRFQSEGVFTADGELDNFHGDDIEGDWLLHITDLLLRKDNGRLFGWSLIIQPEQSYTTIITPPVVPPIFVGATRKNLMERHEKFIEIDGRISEITVQVQLGVDRTAEQLYLPTLVLVHPDGTQVTLSDWNIPFCTIGNFTNLIFSDLAQISPYTCDYVTDPPASGSGSGLQIMPTPATTSTSNQTLFNAHLNLTQIRDFNVTIPVKFSQADILIPTQPLSSLIGKLASGKWTLLISSGNDLASTLYGWSVRVARQPNIDATFNTSTSTLYLTGADSAENYEAVLRSIVYNNMASEPDFSVPRTITTIVSDGQNTSDVTMATRYVISVHHIEIDLDPLNSTESDSPGYFTRFQEHGSPIPVLDSDNAILRDMSYLSGVYTLTATLKQYGNFNEEGLSVNTSLTPGLVTEVTNSTSTGEFVITITSNGSRPIESFQSALRTFEYFNFAEEFVGFNRTVEFQVIDRQMGSRFVSFVATATIELVRTNDRPVLVLNSAQFSSGDQFSNIVSYTEGQGSLELANSSAIILTDNDHDFLVSVNITILNPQDSFNEFLQANTTGTTISAEYNLTDYTLVLFGRASLAEYIQVLGTVSYENGVHTPGLPGTTAREISFIPNDGSHDGYPAISLVTFTAVNDPAFGDLNGGLSGTTNEATFLEERGPVSIISPNATLYDVDDLTLAYIEVQIVNIQDPPLEQLTVMSVEETQNLDSKTTSFTNLEPVTSYDPQNGILRISGLDSIREYQEVLKTLTYNNLADEPNNVTREIMVTLNDSRSLSLPLYVTVAIELINDSPYLDSQLPELQFSILEDISNNDNFGVTVFEISGQFIDDDFEPHAGIAVVGLQSQYGAWEYTINGADWFEIQSNVSLSYGLALEAGMGVSIRFVPEQNWNGIVTLTAVGWDLTDGESEMYLNAQSNSSTDAFSSEATLVTVVVEPVNDVPILQNIPVNLTTISEDDFTSYGDRVEDLTQFVMDFDLSDNHGIAVIEADQENGVWQFTTNDGASWENFGLLNASSALLLQGGPNNRIRFVPAANFNGEVNIEYLAWDQTRLPDESTVGSAADITSASGSGSGSGMLTFEPNTTEALLVTYPSGTRGVNITTSDPITGPFSVQSTTAGVVVEPVNDSPLVMSGMTLHNITEDTDPSENHGTPVSDIISGFYEDIDSNPTRGLAVVGVSNFYGEWQFTCESPLLGNWSTFIGGMFYGQVIPLLPQPDMATLLPSNCWIRFLPNQYFNSEFNTNGIQRNALPYIIVHGWDNTGLTAGRSGSYGNDATYAMASHTNEYSSNSVEVSIFVISRNNVPILRLGSETESNFETVFVEDREPVYAVGREGVVIDHDHARLVDLTITISGSEFDTSPFDGLVFNTSDLSSGSGMGPSGSGMGQSGSGMGQSGSGIEPESDPLPVLSSTPNYTNIRLIQSYVAGLPDPTDEQLYCSGTTARREGLVVQTTPPDLLYEVVSYCPYVLRLYANPSIASGVSKDMFTLALRSLRYSNTIEEPVGGARTLTFVASDNVGLSMPSNSTVFVQLVNDLPKLDLNINLMDVNNFVSYTEGQGGVVLTNDTKISLTDTDNQYLQYARVVLTNAPDTTREILNASVSDLSLDFDPISHVLTLSGNQSLTTYSDALSSVTYTNTYADPGQPNEDQRVIEFYVSDGFNESIVATTFVSFTGVNNKPYLDVNGNSDGVNYTTTFTEEQGPVNIVSSETIVRDEDNQTLDHIRVQLLDPVEMFYEYLSVDNVTLTSILSNSSLSSGQAQQIINIIPNMTYDYFSDTLTISGLASVQEYQLVLRTIKYHNMFDEPLTGNRTIQFIANDGLLDSTPVHTEVDIIGFNDSPFFNISAPEIPDPLILEGDSNNAGIMVPMFAYTQFADDDRPNFRGIAIVDIETENGYWEFSLDGGTTWDIIDPNTNIQNNALLLSANLDHDNVIRFVPDDNYHGNATAVFVLWDGTDNMPPGDTRSAVSMSQTDSFSNDSRTLTIVVVPVNDAPEIDENIQPSMTPILEDSVREWPSIGDEVQIFLQPLVGDVDIPIEAHHHFGIAVVGVNDSNGYWQFSINGGLNWTDFGSPTEERGVVLNSEPPNENRIRFVPEPNFYGQSRFQYKLWDRNQTWPSGDVIDTRTDPITGTFSVGIATARLEITPVNDSPMLSGEGSLLSIGEDTPLGINRGTDISVIIDPIYSDIDTPVASLGEVGLAVVAVDERYGEWLWSCDPGTVARYNPFIGDRVTFDTIFGQVSQNAPLKPNEFRATLLNGNCRVRFSPMINYNTEFDLDGFPRDQNDKPFISVRAWDGTSGQSQDVGVDTTSDPDDHTNAFGEEIIRISITIFSSNDPPDLLLGGASIGYSTTFTEAVPPQRTVVPVHVADSEGMLSDPDNALLQSLSFTLQIYDFGFERLLINTTGTDLNYTTSIVNISSGVFFRAVVEPISGSGAPVEQFESVLLNVLYENSAEEPSNQIRALVVTAIDVDTGFSTSQTEIRTILVNDPPQFDLANNWPDSYYFVSYREGQGALGIVPQNSTLIDFDSPILASARVALTTVHDPGHEILGASSDNSITVTMASNGSELLLQGPGSVEEFLQVLKTVTYTHNLSDPGDPSPFQRTIEFVVSDGANYSIPALVYLSFTTINNAPFLDANGRLPGVVNTVTFFEEQSAVSLISPQAMLEDIDNTTLEFIQVTILNAADSENELLYVEDVTITDAPMTNARVSIYNFRPQQSYNSDTSTLTITGLETVFEFQEVLKTLKYDNLANEPSSIDREIQLTLSDGVLNRTAVYVMVLVENVNDSPYFDLSVPIYEPRIQEDISQLENPGFTVQELLSGDLVLDDDFDSMRGVAIIGAESENGYWEVTWDWTTEREVSSGSNTGSGMEFDGLTPASGSGDMPNSGSNSGSGMGSGMSDSSGGSASGSGDFGSGMFMSGDQMEPITEAPPKCMMTTPPSEPIIEESFFATWYRIPNDTSLVNSVLLKSEGNGTRIRFLPNKDFNGVASLAFVAWDTTDGLVNGEKINATSRDRTDSFSSESVVATMTIYPVNDVPLLSNQTIQLTTILEDDLNSIGNQVSDFTIGITDIDSTDSLFGIAITQADETKGAWQITTDSGQTWTSIYDICPYNATVLRPHPQNRIRFLPNRDFNGNVTFMFKAWDLTSDLPSGTTSVDTTITSTITGPFSNTQAEAVLQIEPINDSPVLTPGARLETIVEDTPVDENEGTLVWDILDGYYHDVDTQDVRGLAVRGVDLRYGTWEWNCPQTNTWTQFFGDFLYGVFVPPNPRPEKATLLDGNCRVRFLPDLNFNTLRDTNGDLRPMLDLPYISIVAWDVTVGEPGSHGIDTTGHTESIINEYSSDVENVFVQVTSVNDLPVVTISMENGGLSFSNDFIEEQRFVKLVDSEFVSISDEDHSRLESVMIVLNNSIDAHSELILLDFESLSNDSSVSFNYTTNTLGIMGQTTFTVYSEIANGNQISEEIQAVYNIYTGPGSPSTSLTLTAAPGHERASLHGYQTLLQYLIYTNINPEPNNETRVFNFYFDDSEDVNSEVVARVEIQLLNDNAPLLINPLPLVVFVEDSNIELGLASENLTLTDLDHNEYFLISNATVTLTPIPESDLENISVLIPSGDFNVTQTYSPDEGILRIEGHAHISVYQDVLRTLIYQNNIEEPLPGNRMVAIQVYDGGNHGNIQRVTIETELINDQVPEIETPNFPFEFTERTHAIGIGTGILVSDGDSGGFPLTLIAVTIENAFDEENEILETINFGRVNSSYQSPTLLLTGPAPIQDFQATLSTLSYNNMAEEPNPATRNITIIVHDQNFNSTPGVIQVLIGLVNDIPVINIPPHVTMVNYVEGSGASTILSNVTITDNDHSDLELLTVQVLNPLDQPNEILDVSIRLGVNITTDYNHESGLLVLTGVASLSDYTEVINTLTYENLEADPGFPDTSPRMVQLVAFDGKNYSMAADLLVTFQSVNDAPIFDLNRIPPGRNYSTSFTEEGPAVNLTSPEAVLFDVDNTSLSSLRVTIENLVDGFNEILQVSPELELDLAHFSYSNGVLLIEGLGDVSNYEQVLRAVEYVNFADEPNFETRLISFLASDGLLESEVVYTTVDIIPINDPPRLYIAGGVRTTPLSAVTTPPLTDSSGSGSGDSGSGLNAMSGSGELISGSGSGSGSGDPLFPTTPPQPTVDPASILENTTLSDEGDYSVIYVENSLPVQIIDVNGTVIEDDDHMILVRFEAILNNAQDAGFETIFFDSGVLSNSLIARLFTAAPVAGGYLGNDLSCTQGSDAIKHQIIDIGIELSVSEWEEVVKSLRYCNGDEHPSPGLRNVTLRIQDPALDWSNEQVTVVDVIPVNDAPICSPLVNMYTINEDNNLTISGLSTCFDHEENLTAASIRIMSQPALGQVIVDPETGDLFFLPHLDDYGTRQFAYQACDSRNFCSNPHLITVVINPVNDPPFAIPPLTFSVLEDSIATIQLTQFFGDVEDDLISRNQFPRVMGDIQGSARSTIGQVNDINSTILYEPFLNYFGEEQLTMDVCDSNGACVVTRINITVIPVNDLPVVSVLYSGGVAPLMTTEDVRVGVSVLVEEVEDRSPVQIIVTSVGNGEAIVDTSSTVVNFDLQTSNLLQTTTIIYTPNQDYHGNDTIIFQAVDSENGITEAAIEVLVSYVNDPPFFEITQITILEDSVTTLRLPIDLEITDPENILNAGSIELISGTELGNVSYSYNQSSVPIPAYGELVYQPPEHYFTADNETISFVLRACDHDTIDPPLCTNATIHIVILSDNDAPHLPRRELTIWEDNNGTIDVYSQVTDVEEGQPPIENIFLIEPTPTRGIANYDPSTGLVLYTPFLNEYGLDYVYYNACDAQNHCSQLRGVIEITILEVNDPPMAVNFQHISREDDFDLIVYSDQFSDNETSFDDLRIEIVQSDGSYSDEWVTNIGGRLRVYHAHQILTYLPPENYVGPDSFTYAVCDSCDPRRDAELGRVDPDPECSRQLIENGGSLMKPNSQVYITCVEAIVEIVIQNINDVPIIGDVAGMTGGGLIFLTPFEDSIVTSDLSVAMPEYFYRNDSKPVFDFDDQQLYQALSNGLNLTEYNLESDSDIDQLSLILKSNASNGISGTLMVNNITRISYVPDSGFSGYDSFTYEICDKQRLNSDPPRCSEGTARIWVTKPGPEISSVTAISFMTSNGLHSDSKISSGDTISVMFNSDTNMPPYESTNNVLTSSDIENIFNFDPPFFIDEVTAAPLEGRWVSPRELIITIADEGYPVPFITTSQNNIESFSEIKIGEWVMTASDTVGPCGGFDLAGQPLANLSPYCLQTADKNSFHSVSQSPALEGNFGLKLPEILNVVIKNTAIDDELLNNEQVLLVDSQISLLLQPPLSYAQLQQYCSKPPQDLLDGSMLGLSVDLSIVGCANLLDDGQVAEEVYETQINLMRSAFSSSAGRRKREIEEDSSRERRQIVNGVAIQPVASEIVLQINNLQNPTVNPAANPRGFVQLISESFEIRALAEVVSETLGIPIDDLIDDVSNTGANRVQDPFYYLEADDLLTPQIERVTASDPDNADDIFGEGDLITIFFDRNTNQPAVDTKSALDLIFIFEPSLGAEYTGEWVTASVLEIEITDPGDPNRVTPSANPLNFNLTFTPNYFHTGEAVTATNTILPTSTPWCVGINVCGVNSTTGSSAQSIGICDENGRSCRAYQGWSSLEGNFGTGEPIEIPIFPWWYIVIAIVVIVIIIGIVIIVVLVYRYYKRKAERKEALRVVKRWKKEQFTPGREIERKDGPKPWVKPPDVATMRENPDPFNIIQKLPEVVPRPATALTEVENLPPLPFKPRGNASIRPSLGSLGGTRPLPQISRTVSAGSLPPALGLPPLTRPPGESRTERRTTLPPLRGGGVLTSQARNVLGDTSPPGSGALPGELLPRTLPPMRLPGSPTSPLGLGPAPLLSPPLVGKGKAPVSGRPLIKKSPPASSDEDVSSSDREAAGAGSDSALPTLSPQFKPTRTLPPITLPPIGGAALPPIRSPRPSLSASITGPPSMPSRRTSIDPFAADPVSPGGSGSRRVTPVGPLTPPRPLVRSPPTPQGATLPPVKTNTALTSISEEAGRKDQEKDKS